MVTVQGSRKKNMETKMEMGIETGERGTSRKNQWLLLHSLSLSRFLSFSLASFSSFLWFPFPLNPISIFAPFLSDFLFKNFHFFRGSILMLSSGAKQCWNEKSVSQQKSMTVLPAKVYESLPSKSL